MVCVPGTRESLAASVLRYHRPHLKGEPSGRQRTLAGRTELIAIGS